MVAGGIFFIGSYDGNLYAVDQNSGQEIWRFKTGDAIASSAMSAVVMDDVIYFGSFYGYLYAVKHSDKR